VFNLDKINANELYDLACKKVSECISYLGHSVDKTATFGSENADQNIELVSGGSAWADHIAVTLFRKNRHAGMKLKLFLPCRINENGFYGNMCAKTLNERHKKFSKEVFGAQQINFSLNELYELVAHARLWSTPSKLVTEPQLSCVIDMNGFKSRNSKIAEHCDYLIAVIASDDFSPGTRDTWNKFNKISVDHKMVDICAPKKQKCILLKASNGFTSSLSCGTTTSTTGLSSLTRLTSLTSEQSADRVKNAGLLPTRSLGVSLRSNGEGREVLTNEPINDEK
jgi:hypothetical protein